MALQFIDISHFQSSVNPKALNADGIILRVGYTGWGSKTPTLDKKFDDFYKAYHDAGVPIGIYYLTQATNEAMVKKETDWVLFQINDKKIELPIWVDCEGEPNNPEWMNLTKIVRSELIAKWCDRMQDAGYYCGIYASKSWFTGNFDYNIIANYDKWVAQYYERCTYDKPYGMWQYTSSESGTAHGISSSQDRVDASWVYKDYKTIIRGAGLNHLDKLIPDTDSGVIPLSNYDYIEVSDGVVRYSKAKHGECFFTIDGRVSNFKVKEFACHDPAGVDEILIDGNLVRYLQRIRDKYGVTTITSAYRTPYWNKHEGGASGSQHLLGKASDTVVRGTSPLEIAMCAEAMGMGGIGLYAGFTHIDTRPNPSKWDNTSGKQVGVSTFLKTIRIGSVGERVRIAQRRLGIKDDGIFGSDTKKKTIAFQALHNLEQDGIIGVKTWRELLK